MITLREYQVEANEAPMEFWAAGGGNPVMELATGLGKSVCIAKLNMDLAQAYPSMRFLNLVDSQELVEQNYMALIRMWPQAPAGIYCAGLGRRDLHQKIIFASVASVFNKAEQLGPRQLVLVDEVHMVPHDGDGMYRTMLDALRELEPNLRVGGFTATPFRMKGGPICSGDGALFDKIVFSYGIGQGIADGWLSPLTGRRGSQEIDLTGVGKQAGDFKANALAEAVDKDAITRAAAADMTRTGREEGRKSWLVFCVGVANAYHVRDALRDLGVAAETVTGETDKGERRRIITDFKAGRITALTNADVLTKGFDAPGVDMVALLRPTLSPGLLLQMIGRGTRPVYPPGFNTVASTVEERVAAIAAGPKPDCRVLDFAGNIMRHGPVDTITMHEKRRKGVADPNAVKTDDVRAKVCPQCQELAALNARICRSCDYEWPHDDTADHDARAADVAILSKDLKPVDREIPVTAWSAARHEKFGGKPSLRVVYAAGVAEYPEWWAFEHGGPIAYKAERWWVKCGGAMPTPKTVDDALARFGELRMPAAITVKKNGKWFDVLSRRFAQSTIEDDE